MAGRRVVLRGKEEIGQNKSIGKKVSWFSLAVPPAARCSCSTQACRAAEATHNIFVAAQIEHINAHLVISSIALGSALIA